MEPIEPREEDDPVLDQFRDDDEHKAAWNLFSDVDDRVESMYETGDLVQVNVRSHLTDLSRFGILEEC